MTDTIQDRLRRTEKDTDLEGDVFHIPVNPDGPAAAAHIDAQDAKIKALVEAGQAVVKDASRQDLHGLGALNDVVTPYLIDKLSAALAAAKETTA